MVTEQTAAPVGNAHSVENFNPAEYEVLDYLDNKPPQYFGQPMAVFEAQREAWKRAIREYFPTSACVTTGSAPQLPEHNIHKCRHCGQTNVRYIVAVRHIPTNVNVVFGDVCVGHLGFRNHNEFRAAQVRARAAQGNANLAAYRRRLQFLDQYPALKQVIESGEIDHPVHANNSFVKDVLQKFNKYGTLSERQITALLSSLQRDHNLSRNREERERTEVIRRQTASPAPSGRATVEGQVLMAKNYDSDLGGVRWKMLVMLTNGAKVFVAVPAALLRLCTDPRRDLREKFVRFTASFTPKPDDVLFAYGKRPTGGEILATLAMPQLTAAPSVGACSTAVLPGEEE
jgi:hypothetical protein